jgi:hypothetical protein
MTNGELPFGWTCLPPKDNFYRRLKQGVDFTFLYAAVEPYFCDPYTFGEYQCWIIAFLTTISLLEIIINFDWLKTHGSGRPPQPLPRGELMIDKSKLPSWEGLGVGFFIAAVSQFDNKRSSFFQKRNCCFFDDRFNKCLNLNQV